MNIRSATLVAIMSVSLVGCASFVEKPLDVSKETKSLGEQLNGKRVVLIGQNSAGCKPTEAVDDRFRLMGARAVPSTEKTYNDIVVDYQWSCPHVDGAPVCTLTAILHPVTLGLIPIVCDSKMNLNIKITQNSTLLFNGQYNTSSTDIGGWPGLLLMPFAENGFKVEQPMSEVLINKFIKDIESEEIF